MIGQRGPDGDAPRYFGVYPATVTNIANDSDGIGRIEVKFPWLGKEGEDVRAMATLCSPYADADQGLQILPEVGSQVVVAFEAGELKRPYIIGACWNGKEDLPDGPAAANDIRVLKTRAGSKLEFDDALGGAKVSVSMASGHRLELDDAAQEVRLTHANGCVITMDVAGQVSIQANASLDITAPVMNVHAPTATFDGIINCKSVVCESAVVSPTYMPGAGNIW